MQWIQYREVDDSEQVADASATETGKGDGSKSVDHRNSKDSSGTKKTPYIKAPADAALGNYSCPICQENFETVWHDDAQEWVWLDAIQSGQRVFHASCHEEVSREAGTSTPMKKLSPVLGKRKAEALDTGGSSLKKELLE